MVELVGRGSANSRGNPSLNLFKIFVGYLKAGEVKCAEFLQNTFNLLKTYPVYNAIQKSVYKGRLTSRDASAPQRLSNYSQGLYNIFCQP